MVDGPTPAIESEVVFIDFETTGVAEGYDSEPWQIGLAFLSRGRVAGEFSLSSLLRVGDRPFNPYAPGRHASIRDELFAAPSLSELWPTLRPWLVGRTLGAHNAGTERGVLAHAFPLHAFGPWVDTLDLVRIAYPGSASHKLEDIIQELGLAARLEALCPALEPHDALFDATASAVLLEYLLALPEWEGVTVGELVRGKPHRFHRQRARRGRRSDPLAGP